MSIFVDGSTRVLVQGITGSEGSFHARQCIEYGTKVVAGVTPGRGGEEHLGDEEDSVAKVDADDPHALDECVIQNVGGRPAPLEEEVGSLCDLVGQAVVEIIVHLRNELLVRQRG